MSVKIIYLDGTESLICSRVIPIAQTSAVYMDAESGNVMEITVSDGKTIAQVTEFPPMNHLYKQECNTRISMNTC